MKECLTTTNTVLEHSEIAWDKHILSRTFEHSNISKTLLIPRVFLIRSKVFNKPLRSFDCCFCVAAPFNQSRLSFRIFVNEVVAHIKDNYSKSISKKQTSEFWSIYKRIEQPVVRITWHSYRQWIGVYLAPSYFLSRRWTSLDYKHPGLKRTIMYFSIWPFIIISTAAGGRGECMFSDLILSQTYFFSFLQILRSLVTTILLFVSI